VVNLKDSSIKLNDDGDEAAATKKKKK
jgi:hypothetical protein